jgi:hypothetical protein
VVDEVLAVGDADIPKESPLEKCKMYPRGEGKNSSFCRAII